MSRGYTKTYGRKVGNVCTQSIQFDKLFKENSNRPSAAKSAGTIGKWGITSFTSIRSTNIIGPGGGGRKEYTVGKKRGRTDSQNSRVSSDSFSFDNDSDSGASNVVKPKKFFKSRNAEPVPLSSESKPKSNIASYGGGYNPRKIDKVEKPVRQSRSSSSSKRVPIEETPDSPPRKAFPTAAARKSVCSPEPPPLDQSAPADKPPIVLRIFKGTSQLVTPVTTPTTPPIDSILSEGTEISVQSRTDTSVHLHIEHKAPGSSPDSVRTDSSVNSRSRGRGSGSESESVSPNPRAQRVKRLRKQRTSVSEPTVASPPSVSTRASRYTRRAAAMDNTGENMESEPLARTPTAGHAPAPVPAPVPAPAPSMRTTRAASRASAPLINPTFAANFAAQEDAAIDEEDTNYVQNSELVQMDVSYPDGSAPALSQDPSSPLTEPLRDEGNADEEEKEDEEIEAASEVHSDHLANEHLNSSVASDPSSPLSQNTAAPPSESTLLLSAGPTLEEEPSLHSNQQEYVPSPQHVQEAQPAKLDLEAVVAPISEIGAMQQDWSSESETEVDPLERELSAITEGRTSERTTNVKAAESERTEPALSVRERLARRHMTNSAAGSSSSSSDGLSRSSSEPGSSAPNNPPVQTQRKKGSIFKSRALQSADEGKKRLALYKHKWSDDKDGASTGPPQPGAVGANLQGDPSSQPSGSAYNLMEEEFAPETSLTRVTSWPAASADLIDEPEAITSIKCHKNAKGFYTVVRNVKKAHQIQESGEFQEFNDDVEYILDALQEQNPIGTRCLSAITLASKCMAPAFRMHVRAHGTVAKFFKALHDATKDQSLGLCTATVMFVLSQDRLNMDLDRDSLELMLNLLECDASHRNALEDCGLSSAQLRKNKQKVRELCAEIQSQGHAKHLNLDNITVGHLAMETLLSLTSKRAGEWFKEELRELGGLEHIIKTICQCCSQVDDYVVEWTDPLLDRLRKVDRCLRVLENVTHQNEENQVYLLRYENGALVDVLIRMFRLCCNEIPLYPVLDPAEKESTGVVIREALLANLKVLINLTHDFKGQSYGSRLAGERKGIMEASMLLLLQTPNYVTEEKRFDVIVLALTLLINLVEHSEPNRALLINTKAPADTESVFACDQKGAVEALIAMFYRQEESARNEEAKTDAILDGKETKDETENPAQQQPAKTQEEFIEETVSKLLTKAGRHMEHTFVAAYIGLLVGYIIMDNKEREELVRLQIPDHSFKTMVAVLQKFFNFMNLTVTSTGSSRGLAATEKVIKYMAKIDLEAEMEDSKSEVDTEVGMHSDCDALDESISS